MRDWNLFSGTILEQKNDDVSITNNPYEGLKPEKFANQEFRELFQLLIIPMRDWNILFFNVTEKKLGSFNY